MACSEINEFFLSFGILLITFVQKKAHSKIINIIYSVFISFFFFLSEYQNIKTLRLLAVIECYEREKKKKGHLKIINIMHSFCPSIFFFLFFYYLFFLLFFFFSLVLSFSPLTLSHDSVHINSQLFTSVYTLFLFLYCLSQWRLDCVFFFLSLLFVKLSVISS